MIINGGPAFDVYPKDMVSRAQVFAKFASAEGTAAQQALYIAGSFEAVDQ